MNRHHARRRQRAARQRPPVPRDAPLERRLPRAPQGPQLRRRACRAAARDRVRRGLRRHLRGARARARRRGRLLPAEPTPSGVTLAYEGLDGRLRSTRLAFDPPPDALEQGRATFPLRLPPRLDLSQRVAIDCEAREGGAVAMVRGRGLRADRARPRADEPVITTSNERFNDWLNRSVADLHMMRTETRYGPYPYAGVPWFSTVFGRDGIVTALECLWAAPALARGVLRYLAATQADSDSPRTTRSPARSCTRSAAARWRARARSCSRATTAVRGRDAAVRCSRRRLPRAHGGRRLRPRAVAASSSGRSAGSTRTGTWTATASSSTRGAPRAASSSRAGRTRRTRVPPRWFSGRGADHALRGAGARVRRLVQSAAPGSPRPWKSLRARASSLGARAKVLRRRFEEAFWSEELAPTRSRSTGRSAAAKSGPRTRANACTAASRARARARRTAAPARRRVLLGLGHPYGRGDGGALQPDVLPQRLGLAARQRADRGRVRALRPQGRALRLMTGLFDASLFFDLHRLPELFCGFHRRPGESPTHYPVSCAPQAWASGSALLLLQASLNLRVLGAESRWSSARAGLAGLPRLGVHPRAAPRRGRARSRDRAPRRGHGHRRAAQGRRG